MEITNQILNHLPWKKKSTPSGWISFNAPCCQHLGHESDTRGRGGVHQTLEGGINYHCFNCHYTCSWQPGRRLSYKMRRWMNWLGMGEDLVGRLALFAISQETAEPVVVETRELPTYEPRDPCPGRPITSWLNDGYINEEDYNSLETAIRYLDARGFYFYPCINIIVTMKIIQDKNYIFMGSIVLIKNIERILKIFCKFI